MSVLPVNIDASYPDGADPSVQTHQQHHDALHAMYNDLRDARLVAMVAKTVTESRVSDAVLAADSEIFLPVEASSSYLLEFHFVFTGTREKSTLVGPTGATLAGTYHEATAADVQDASLGVTIAGESAAQRRGLIFGVLAIGGTAGTVELQWAQNTTSGTATAVKAGSFLRLTKL